jgi:hypothetical protein
MDGGHPACGELTVEDVAAHAARGVLVGSTHRHERLLPFGAPRAERKEHPFKFVRESGLRDPRARGVRAHLLWCR